jgi:hypothetical protein
LTRVNDDDLGVRWHPIWFRQRHPHGTIETELVAIVLRVTVTDSNGHQAGDHGPGLVGTSLSEVGELGRRPSTGRAEIQNPILGIDVGESAADLAWT